MLPAGNSEPHPFGKENQPLDQTTFNLMCVEVVWSLHRIVKNAARFEKYYLNIVSQKNLRIILYYRPLAMRIRIWVTEWLTSTQWLIRRDESNQFDVSNNFPGSWLLRAFYDNEINFSTILKLTSKHEFMNSEDRFSEVSRASEMNCLANNRSTSRLRRA